ncbi:peptide ABC transporter substrate-binding protein [Peterkaempfera griseoplana]|uniref:peptide ABC transporter substrate-binding protein n=1 Tax=Peterkaempfera griseoplana TaxID=66896 RepID=UPI0006E3B66D|nr:ABC transporter substrate-binding protein [Peterkaempfera griseoplana]
MRGATQAKWVMAAAAVALAATACGSGGGGSSSGSASGGGGVVTAFWGDPQTTLEPANVNEVNGGKVLDMIFQGLQEYDAKTGKARLAAAESITTTDAQNYTIKLKSGLKFSDGEPVNAASFVDAWNYGALSTNAQLNSSFFGYIEGYDKVHPDAGKPSAKTMSGLKKVDDLTFTVKLTQKFSTFPDTLGYSAYYPVPAKFFTDHAAWVKNPVGNGTYKITSWTKGQGMSLVPNPEYQGDMKAQNKGVDLKVYTSDETAYQDLVAGNLDVMDQLPATQTNNAQSDLQGRYINQPAGIVQTVSFPLYKKDWNTAQAAKVRQGLSMLIDRPSITKTVLAGTYTPATDWTSPVLGEAGYSKDMLGEFGTYDPAKGKQLIEEGGGIPGGKLTISYNADRGNHKLWVDAVCNTINKALGGGTCVGNPVGTFASFRDQVTSKQMTGLFRTGWQMDYPTVQDFLEPLYTTNGSSNDGKWSNKEFDKLVGEANAETDSAKAVATYQQAEKLLVQEMPVIPLWYQNATAGYGANIGNVQLNPFSVPVYSQITKK